MSTIKDISRLTGLSIATISKYLNGGSLKENNRLLIEKAIKELDYNVNFFARSLKTKKTMTIGVCLPLLENLFFMKIVSVIEEILLINGYSTIICDYREEQKLEKERLDFLVGKKVDGIVLVPSYLTAEDINKTVNGGVPVVLLDRAIKGAECDHILMDNVNAAYRAVEELIVRKHRRIGVVLGPRGIYTAEERMKGCLRVFDDYGLEYAPTLFKLGDYKIESGYLLMNEFLDMEEPPSAVFVTNYEMTIGAMIALNERNVSVPDELSIIGFDNIALARLIKPPLTIAAQPMDEIGRLAATTMLKRLRGDYGDFPVYTRLKADITINGSVSAYSNIRPSVC